MNPHPVIAALVALLGPEGVRTGDAIGARALSDWSGEPVVRPLALLRPRDTQEVSQALRVCHAHRVPVVPQGGMTGMAGGAAPVAQGVALTLERMQAIEEVDTAAATLTVQAGASLQQVQEAAQAAGLALGLDFGARGSCQIGGVLATNAGGNGVVQFGMAREQVLGLEVVLADGTVLPMLRPMRKNNTGYDLKHWFIGSEGTLGVITRAVLALRAAPRARVSALVALREYDSAMRLLRTLQAEFPGALAAFELMWDDFFSTALAWSGTRSPLSERHPFVALLETTGADEGTLVERLHQVLGDALDRDAVAEVVVAQSQAQARSLWHIREMTAEFPSRMAPLNFDISLPLARIEPFATACVQALSRRWPAQRCLRFGHLGDGNLHLTVDLRSLDAPDDPSDEVQALVYGLLGEYGGSISAEHGIGLHKKPYLFVSRTPEEIAAMRAIKSALDPFNLLNPGKVFDLHAPT